MEIPDETTLGVLFIKGLWTEFLKVGGMLRSTLDISMRVGGPTFECFLSLPKSPAKASASIYTY